MTQAARARDSWADPASSSRSSWTPTRRARREPASWASAEDLEILGGIGEERIADWTVLTLERDDVAATRTIAANEDVVRLHRDDIDPPTTADRTVLIDDAAVGRSRRRRRAQPDVARARTAPVAPQLDDDTAEPAHAASAPRDVASPRAGAHSTAAGGRRTVVIRGQVAPARDVLATGDGRRRPSPRTRDRVAHRPDRVAMWAVMLGLLLIVVATMTAG